ncbi:SixA phosphatase family protein [Arundinibacter roseus]|uniref:Phosphohistidine phosphatase n=1 Tax=Arundinibacter roseus TaxID=2070510 RepID=A0A4R4KEW6_9BACT|nr:histidine phosphatase family protein [Arundinibacter roseus]TDB65091.1 phosphohistidine phosphatase [Arundinibacter roseus]
MKKYLLLVRHAKAEDSSMMLKDFDRELLSQGIMDAARLGNFLFREKFTVNSIKTSAAARAFQTVKVLAEQLKIDTDSIEQIEKLYDGGPQAYLSAVNTTAENVQTLMLCGHNPDISFFAEYLTRDQVNSLSTCDLVVMQFEDLLWAEVSGKTGKVRKHISPKDLK